MKQAAAGARTLVGTMGRSMNDDAARALQTGVVVCYARAFTQSRGYPMLDKKKYAPTDPVQRAVHFDLLRLRKILFAHTDDTEMRRIVDAGALLGIGSMILVEEYQPIPAHEWQRVADLAVAQMARMKQEGDEIAAKLAD